MSDDPLPILDAARLDAADELSGLRAAFHIPRAVGSEAEAIYLCGNSLGPQPRAAAERVGAELERWARLGVGGHFDGERSWYAYHEHLRAPLARLLGAEASEVVPMGSLSTNLHLLLVSFYRPRGRRTKLLIERGAFPSDQYIADSQARLHGLDPAEAVIEIGPRDGESTIREEDIEALLYERGQEIACVMLGGVNYLTGQALDLARITRAAHAAGATVGFDLAHAAGNLALSLHEDGPDFAAWCSYKYLNAGPGAVAGIFVHERHGESAELVRMAGWWGNDPAERFRMPRRFAPQPGAGGWQLSNAPVLSMAALSASLDLFDKAKMARLRAKSERLTALALATIDRMALDGVEIITPRAPSERGAQLSIRASCGAEALRASLERAQIVCDVRPPDIVRVAFAPLYNTFAEVARFCEALGEATATTPSAGARDEEGGRS